MQNTTLAIHEIKRFFPYHRICVVRVLIILTSSILLANNCNLNKAKKKGSIVLGRRTNIASLYTRFIRFFKMKDKSIFIVCILRLVFYILSAEIEAQKEYILSIDRTNWKLGLVNINVLTIGLVLGNGKFIPLYFELLDKRGNSSTEERKKLLEELHKLFELKKPIRLTGDREFIGREWFDILKTMGYDFVVRVRKADYKKQLAEQLKISESKLDCKIRTEVQTNGFFTAQILIEGKLFLYHVKFMKGQKDKRSKAEKDVYIRFISTFEQISEVCETYNKRWKIEVFFEDIKEKGIRLEQIRFKDVMKIRLMVAVASLCYAICIKEGLIQYKKRAATIKKCKTSGKFYLRVSLFTKGFESIEQKAFSAKKMEHLIASFLSKKPKINNASIRYFIKPKPPFFQSV